MTVYLARFLLMARNVNAAAYGAACSGCYRTGLRHPAIRPRRRKIESIDKIELHTLEHSYMQHRRYTMANIGRTGKGCQY